MAKPRNPYEDDVDFSVLALQDADFAKHLKANGQLDFSNAQSVKQLTKSLLKRDFNLQIDLTDDRLCPPVPNRLNYILWIQDLLDSTSANFLGQYDPARNVTGLDIGTGSSCIYPLLACATRPRWRFIATDIDSKNLEYAAANIKLNNLGQRIRLLPSTSEAPLIPLDKFGIDSIDILLTNPPFFPALSALLSSSTKKSRPPLCACTGSEVEMVCPGGEVSFVTRLLTESLSLRTRVQWYSSMLGKLSSVHEIVGLLREKGVKNWAVTEFVQGSRTRRWGVAWSFVGRRPDGRVARAVGKMSGVEKALLVFPPEFEIVVDKEGATKEDIGERVDGIVRALDIRWRWKREIGTGVGFAEGNVWGRKVRRRKEGKSGGDEAMAEGMANMGVGSPERGMTDDDEDGSEDEEEEKEPALGFKVTVKDGENGGRGPKVEIKWLVGMDSVLFESFCGMVKRELSK